MMTTWIAVAALALLPLFLMTATSYVKIAVVLSILRNALGIGQVPSGPIIAALSILLSLYVMAPVGQEIVRQTSGAVQRIDREQPLAGDSLDAVLEAVGLGQVPLREFLVRNSGERERTLFLELAQDRQAADAPIDLSDDDLLVVLPAFLITELMEAFFIGFLLFVPFVVLDLVIANILLTLGMHMTNPTTIALPFKLLLFVSVDGWYLLSRALVTGYV